MSAQTRTVADRVHSRRDLALLAGAGFATLPWGRSAGVKLGVHASSFRNVPAGPGTDAIDRLIRALTTCEARECELGPSLVEPAGYRAHDAGHHEAMSAMTPQMMRRELRKWRLRTPLRYFESIADRFGKAGIRIYAYNYSPDATFSDEEIDRGFAMARALGADILTVSTTDLMARRIAPLASRHDMVVALGGGVGTKVSAPFKTHVDIAQLLTANVDPVAYVRDHHDEITSLYLTDCRKNSGDSVTWGQGDAPIREVLQLLKREGWPIHAYVKYQNASGSTDVVEEVKRCVAYAKQTLA